MTSVRDYLHRYWFRFAGDPADLPPGAALGFGVTAVDVRDGEELLRVCLLDGEPLPAGVDVTEDVDVQTLHPGHVLPNMGDPSVRGVWYPHI